MQSPYLWVTDNPISGWVSDNGAGLVTGLEVSPARRKLGIQFQNLLLLRRSTATLPPSPLFQDMATPHTLAAWNLGELHLPVPVPSCPTSE